MGHHQFGFRNAMETREALFSFAVLVQERRNQQKHVYLCFVDYEKGFDEVKHNKLKECLPEKNLDSCDINIIYEVYWNQNAFVSTEVGNTKIINIETGVRQGCILSTLLFNLYSE